MTYMLTRKTRIAPGQTEKSLLWAQNVTEKVFHTTGLPVRLSQQVFSPEVGTIAWSVFAPNLSTLEGLNEKIRSDSDLIKLIDQGVNFLVAGMQGMHGVTSDILSTVISGNFEEHGALQTKGGPEYQTVVETQLSAGNYQAAMATGQEIAQQVQTISEAPVLFALDQTGYYGGVRWVTSHDNIRHLERSQQRLLESEQFQQLIDSNSEMFSDQPFVTRQYIYQRLLT